MGGGRKKREGKAKGEGRAWAGGGGEYGREGGGVSRVLNEDVGEERKRGVRGEGRWV